MPPERLGAFVLLVAGVAASYWMQSEAARVSTSVTAREQQLEHLQTLAQPLSRCTVDDRSVDALRGLFAGHDVVWLETPAGAVLTLRRSAGEQVL